MLDVGDRPINRGAEADLVLLDELSAGPPPVIMKSIFGAIRRLDEEIGLTVLMS